MWDEPERAILVTVRGGWAVCPYCQNKRLMKVRPDTAAKNLVLYCRACKREFVADISGERLIKATINKI